MGNNIISGRWCWNCLKKQHSLTSECTSSHYWVVVQQHENGQSCISGERKHNLKKNLKWILRHAYTKIWCSSYKAWETSSHYKGTHLLSKVLGLIRIICRITFLFHYLFCLNTFMIIRWNPPKAFIAGLLLIPFIQTLRNSKPHSSNLHWFCSCPPSTGWAPKRLWIHCSNWGKMIIVLHQTWSLEQPFFQIWNIQFDS